MKVDNFNVETQETMRVRLKQKAKPKRSNSLYSNCQHVFKVEQSLQVTLTQEDCEVVNLQYYDCYNGTNGCQMFEPSPHSFFYTCLPIGQHALIPNDASEVQMQYQRNNANDINNAPNLATQSFQEQHSLDISAILQFQGIFDYIEI
ncbi:21479_t:CDS:2 [Cetraspora pellucida]|uniref:21479_t:CDS:1 n=1 Tax=Cetraspora pellucida TaxID=1433469 RepID=A0A9N9EEP4_9GLOM|nr:21479_t:CDS:2 [Cetraspora pellucida]